MGEQKNGNTQNEQNPVKENEQKKEELKKENDKKKESLNKKLNPKEIKQLYIKNLKLQSQLDKLREREKEHIYRSQEADERIEELTNQLAIKHTLLNQLNDEISDKTMKKIIGQKRYFHKSHKTEIHSNSKQSK